MAAPGPADGAQAFRRRRNIVVRADGRPVNVVRPRGQLFVCATGCCCGRTEEGFAPVPTTLYHEEWERRRLRNAVHLTIGGCLGPCALANVVLLLFDGQALWFHSIDTPHRILALYDHIERMLVADRWLPASGELARWQFTASAWQPRPDGQPVDDHRPFRPALRQAASTGPDGHPGCLGTRDEDSRAVDRVIAAMQGAATLPRKNGELVFGAPWQGRAFGMAVALSELGLVDWEEFRQALIAEIAAADAGASPVGYYEAWLAALERVLVRRDVVSPVELEEVAFQFEFGERDEVF